MTQFCIIFQAVLHAAFAYKFIFVHLHSSAQKKRTQSAQFCAFVCIVLHTLLHARLSSFIVDFDPFHICTVLHSSAQLMHSSAQFWVLHRFRAQFLTINIYGKCRTVDTVAQRATLHSSAQFCTVLTVHAAFTCTVCTQLHSLHSKRPLHAQNCAGDV